MMTLYPSQFRLLLYGMLIGSVSFSMTRPFMIVYLSQRLHIPLATVGLVFMLTSAFGFVSNLIIGPIIDRFGRKVVIVVSMGVHALTLAGYGIAHSLAAFVPLMAVGSGFFSTFGPASNTMVADLIGPEKRTEAYGFTRLFMNVGAALGPALGGMIATRSYLTAFMIASGIGLLYCLFMTLFVKETKSQAQQGCQVRNSQRHPRLRVCRSSSQAGASRQPHIGYADVLRDRGYMGFSLANALLGVIYGQAMTILPVYLKTVQQIPENQYGLMISLNGLMVIFFQLPIVHLIEPYPRTLILALGALLIGGAMGAFSLSGDLLFYGLVIVVLSVGEMIFAPTATALTADVAPLKARGTYMAVLNMSWGTGTGLAPALGGVLSDELGPLQVWRVMWILGLLAAMGFMFLGKSDLSS